MPHAEALKKNRERFTAVAWEGDTSAQFRVELQIDGWDRNRLLEDLSRTSLKTGINILEARCTVVLPDGQEPLRGQSGDTQELKTCMTRPEPVKSYETLGFGI